MPRFNDLKDLLWCDSGDLKINAIVGIDNVNIIGNGDLLDTDELELRAFIQKVYTRLNSNRGDWRLLGVGANLASFQGARNAPETAELITNRIANALSEDNFIRLNEMFIDVIPVSQSMVAVIVSVRVPASQKTLTFTTQISLKDNAVIPRDVR